MYNAQSPSPMASTQERCPVCRLFLLPDMLLSEHLDTHPKDQVILALTNLLEKQNKNSSRSSSPWMSTPSSTHWTSTPRTTMSPSLIVNPPLALDNHRQQWSDLPERNSNWQKSQQQSWGHSTRYTVPNTSPRYTQWQRSQNSTVSTNISDLCYDITPLSNSQVSYNEIPNNQIQFATPVTHRARTTITETSQESLSISSTIPVIQRNESLSTNINTNEQSPSPACSYRSLNLVQHENGFNSQCTVEDSGVVTETLEPNTSETEIMNNSESVAEISDNIKNTCIANSNDIDRTSSVANLETNLISTRKEVIIQPEKSRMVLSDHVQSRKIGFNNENVQTDKQNSAIYSEHCDKTRSNHLIVSKSGLANKPNIEILSHSVINNSKLLKTSEVKKLVIKQKKENLNVCQDTDYNVAETPSNNDKSIGLVEDPAKDDTYPQTWNIYDQEEPEIKMLDNEINNEKTYDDYSEQDVNYESEQRRTMFSPNLVIINLEGNGMKLDSNRKLLDIDAYQQNLDSRSVYEFSKNLNQASNFTNSEYNENVYQAHDSFKEDLSPNKSSGSMSFQSQTDFTQTEAPMDEFSSHSGSKLNNCDNFRQNLEHSLSSESLNIRTDEKMPARGELSEQESTDSSTWAYQNAGSSFPLSLPADGNELNLSQYLSPMLEPSSSCSLVNQADSGRSSKSSSTSKQQNIFKCPHCALEFLCAKERRVHIGRSHSNLSGSLPFTKKPNELLRNSFDSTDDYYTPCSSAQNSDTSSYNKDDVKVTDQTNCDNDFDGSLLVSSVNLINNNADVVLEPLGKLDIEMKSADVKTDFNLFNLGNSTSFTETNVKIEDNLSGQSTSKRAGRVSKLKRTIKRNAVRYTYTCIVCQEEFNALRSFNAHLQTHPLECRICAKLFTRKKTFDTHEARHLGFKNHACPHCNKRFYTEQKLRDHERVHSSGCTTIYKCGMCDAKFRRPASLAQHKLSFHNSKSSGKVYFCHCGENFPSLAKLYYHKETHDTKPKNCKYCTQKFVHLISLNRHIRISHNDKIIANTEVCQICNKNLSKLSMRAHMKIHSGNLTHNCFICNKNFSTKWNLKQHKFVHQSRSTKPYKCAMCPSAFVRLQDYKYHLNSHKKIYSFVCNHCGRKFIRKYNYLRHVKEHSQEKKYQCTVSGCTKSFHRNYYLTEHLRTHTGVRPYVCTICSKTSSTKSNHNKHLKIHHANSRDSINMEN